jgi:thiamine biosynthesis protein ThiI
LYERHLSGRQKNGYPTVFLKNGFHAVHRRGEEMEVVMVRYGELFLKSGPVMRHFIQILLRNIGKALDSYDLDHRFEVHRGRLIIHGENPGEIAAVISRIFGIVDVEVCVITSNDFPEIEAEAVRMAKFRLVEGASFAVRARRQGVPGVTSREIGARIGAALCREFPAASVDLSHPDYEIFIEMREFGTVLYDSHILAPGGLPLGTQGKALSLLSAGIDSPVATWLMMKRGCDMATLHIDGGRFAGTDVLAMTRRHHAILSSWSAGFPLTMLVVDAELFFDAITTGINPRFRCVLCKRFMLRVGSRLVESRRDTALVTGDSLGQVASQTLINMTAISEAATVPVLRPLIAFDKNETVAIARKIGTFERQPGDIGCRAVPRAPATAAVLDAVHACEKQVGMESLVEEALENTRIFTALNGVFVENQEP